MQMWRIALQVVGATLLFLVGAVIALDARYLGVKNLPSFLRVTEYAIFGEPKTIKFSRQCFFEGARLGSPVLSSNQSGCMPVPDIVDENIERIDDFPGFSSFRTAAQSVARIDLEYKDKKGVSKIAPCTAFMISDRVMMTALHCFLLPDEDALEELLRSGDVARAALHFGYASELDQTAHSELVDIEIIDHGIKGLLQAGGESDAYVDYIMFRLPPDASQRILAAGFGPAQFSGEAVRPRADLFVIHHPLGDVLHISRRECRAEDLDSAEGGSAAAGARLPMERFSHYCGTLPGTSGAPVFDNETYRVVAMHLAGRRSVVRLAENQGEAIPVAVIANDLKPENADLKNILMGSAPLESGQSEFEADQE